MRTVNILTVIESYYLKNDRQLKNLRVIFESRSTGMFMLKKWIGYCKDNGDKDAETILLCLSRMTKERRGKVVELFWWLRELEKRGTISSETPS
jgi:hypothetical protein